MIPASSNLAKPAAEAPLDTAARPATVAVDIPAINLPALHEKPATPTLLNIRLNLPQGSEEANADAGATGSPRSVSARNRRKGQRSATETRGQKRAIDGRDGPGLGATSSPKRQKESLAPDSPRSSASGKQLVKAPRPVTDLKAMVRLSPRRTESALPPASPRGPATPERTDTDSPGRASAARASSSTAATSSGSAPRWRSASYGEMPDGPSLASPRIPPRIGSMAGLSVLHRNGPGPQPGSDASPAPAPGSSAPSDADDISEFAFSGCEYGEDGRLTATQRDAGAAPARSADPAMLRGAPDSLTLTMLTAELVPTAQAQKDAAAAYLRALDSAIDKPAPGKSSTGSHVQETVQSKAKHERQGDEHGSNDAAPRRAFEAAQGRLETAAMFAEMALNQGDWSEVSSSLKDLLRALASCRTSFTGLVGSKYGRQAGEAIASPQGAVTACLQSLENTCAFGLDVLADQFATHGGAASTASTATQGRLVLTHSTEQLLDDLDVLMNEEIKAAAPAVRGKPHRKQH